MFAKKLFFFLHVAPFLIFLFAGSLLFFLAGTYASNPLPDDPKARIARLEAAGQYAETLPLFEQRLQEDPEDIDLQHAYLHDFFKAFPENPKGDELQEITGQYQAYASAARTGDIGFYGLGEIHAWQGDYDQALLSYQKVKNRRLKYLNSALGEVYLYMKEDEKAAAYFQEEIAGRGDLPAAVSELEKIYGEQNKFEKIGALLTNRETAAFVSFTTRRQYARLSGDWPAYLNLTFLKLLQQVSLPAGLAALLICAVWAVFLRRIDIFRPQPLSILVLVFLLGVCSAMVALVLGDFLPEYLPLPSGPSWFQGLAHSVIYIGFVEELVKFLPVLLLAGLFRPPEEPFDLILLGGMSALGFATLENSLYFTRNGLGLVYPRFLYSTGMHLAMTGTICYAWVKAMVFRKNSRFARVALGFLLAALVHGSYDYFLLYADKRLSVMSIFLALLMISEFYRVIRNTLNISPFFREAPEISRRLTNFGLFSCALLGLLMIVFLNDHFTLSTEIARRELLPLVLFTLPAAIVLLGSLGKFEVLPGEWLPLLNYHKYWNWLKAFAGRFGQHARWDIPARST